VIYCFDIDDTICKTNGENYEEAEPIIKRIEYINKLYDQGNKIIFYTARGYVTKIDWREVTLKQLEDWNVKYNELIPGKPHADVYVDDKGIKDSDFFDV
tara:strand:- start:4625 stop:4921 length:297 start_codon:yes stop_codon:yes gene_type:complete